MSDTQTPLPDAPRSEMSLIERLVQVPPFDHLPSEARDTLAAQLTTQRADAGEVVFAQGSALSGLFVLESGAVDILSDQNEVVSHRGPGEIMGERGLLRDGNAMLTAKASQATEMLFLPAAAFLELTQTVPAIRTWFDRATPSKPGEGSGPYATGLMALQVSDIMSATPLHCAPDTPVRDAAKTMRDKSISSLLVLDAKTLVGIVTVHDLVNKVLAEGLSGDTCVKRVMTPDPVTIDPDATGLDALLIMAERRINHLPVSRHDGKIVGMIGRTDLFRQQSATASHMASDLVEANSSTEMAKVMERLPELLTHLTAAGTKPAAICRRITDLTDAITRRLLALGEETFGPAPVPYLWAACGSQGRREQTGVSDQDNCLIIDDAMKPEDDAYFAKLAQFVSDGLAEAGFIYCPGDMMATNPRWRQPRRVWRSYFAEWISEPDEMAQMLASVMFDLRAIAGDTALFDDLQEETLAMAKSNSIFVHHMISNSLKHAPPLGFFGGLSLIRSGEHKNTVDLKHAGVVPIVDLGRVYALKGGITAVNTRERLKIASENGVISPSGGRDLLDAYDLIAEIRLRHQAAQINAGEAPDNFLHPESFSDLERNHLRDAFLVVKTMQSAVAGLF